MAKFDFYEYGLGYERTQICLAKEYLKRLIDVKTRIMKLKLPGFPNNLPESSKLRISFHEKHIKNIRFLSRKRNGMNLLTQTLNSPRIESKGKLNVRIIKNKNSRLNDTMSNSNSLSTKVIRISTSKNTKPLILDQSNRNCNLFRIKTAHKAEPIELGINKLHN